VKKSLTCHSMNARPYGTDLSLFFNVPVVTVKSKMTVWGSMFHNVSEA